MTIRLHRHDLPPDYAPGPALAVDTEAMGLNPHRDRLCVVQMSRGDGDADLVQILPGRAPPPHLLRILADESVLKIFHFARFDVALLFHSFGVMPQPLYCTKIASKLARTYTDRHGLKDLVRELLGFELSKQQQSSDWGAETLSQAQLDYAAADVLHLHALKDRLDQLLAREGRADLARRCFGFLPARAELDLAGWSEVDVFAHT
jgi:ribonuclease D